MRGFFQDFRYSVRSVLKHPGFVLVVVLTLALAMGPNTLIFTLLDAVFISEGPYKDASDLLILNQEEKTRVPQRVSYPNFDDWRKMSRSFSEMAAYRSDQVLFRAGDSVRRVHAESVSLDFFRVLGVDPILGRTFVADDFRLDAPRAVVLKYGEWQKEFGGRPDVIGTEIVVDRVPGRVIGVMPSNFSSLFYGRGARLWVPLLGRAEQEDRAEGFVEVIGRPKPGIGRADVDRELTVIAAQLASAYPEANETKAGIRARTIREVWLSSVGPAPRIIGPLVLSVLLVACANVANLLLARGVVRKKEIALRRALGAGRLRLIRQLLLESSLMGLAGGVVGLLFAYWGLGLFNRYLDLASLGIDHLGIDTRTLQFTAIMGISSGIIFGLLPSVKISKISLIHAIKEGGAITGRVKSRLAGILVVSELSIALIMLTVVSLFIASSLNSINISYQPGFRVSDVLTADLSVSEQAYETPDQKAGFYTELLRRTAQVPGIAAAGLVSGVPGGYSPERVKVAPGLTDSSLPPEKAPGIWVDYRLVTPDYFKTLGIPVLQGRSFTDFDNANAPRVVLVSQRGAAAVWKGRDPIGETLSINGVPHTVVGIVADVRTSIRSTNREEAEVIVPYLQQPRGVMSLVARTKGSPDALIPEVKARFLTVGQNDASAVFRTMEQYLYGATRGHRFLIGLVASFGLLASLIAAAGVYGIMSHFVSQKVPEIGIRMALGAGRKRVLRQVMREGGVLILLGIAVGCPIALLLIRFLPRVLFGVVQAGFLMVGAVTLSLAAVAILACYLPARRASRVDPLVALRYE